MRYRSVDMSVCGNVGLFLLHKRRTRRILHAIPLDQSESFLSVPAISAKLTAVACPQPVQCRQATGIQAMSALVCGISRHCSFFPRSVLVSLYSSINLIPSAPSASSIICLAISSSLRCAAGEVEILAAVHDRRTGSCACVLPWHRSHKGTQLSLSSEFLLRCCRQRTAAFCPR